MPIKNIFKLLLKLVFAVVLLLIVSIGVLMLMPAYSKDTRIDFTRHLDTYYQTTDDTVNANQDEFFGIPGSARMMISSSGQGADIVLNGATVATSEDFANQSDIEIPVELKNSNTIKVSVNGMADNVVTVRVKQIADVQLHVESRVHFNTNVSNFTQAREFYGKLGFGTVSTFPDNNTFAMAQAIGITEPTSYDGSQGGEAGGYLLHGELIGVSGFGGGVIDLIDFTIPKNEEPPYAKINHLGMAKAAMYTTDINADYAYMSGIGVEFVAAPTTRKDGTSFALFKDPDGTYYELINVAGESKPTETTHITQLGHLNVTVSDFDRSLAWYQMIGYELERELAATDSIEVSRAMGFDQPHEIKGAILKHHNDGSTIELVQWISPFNPEPPYPIPVNHLGIHRTAFYTNNMAADVAALKAQGVEFVSEPTPCCSGHDSSGSIVAFYDPDGVIVELVEQPFMGIMFSVMRMLSSN